MTAAEVVHPLKDYEYSDMCCKQHPISAKQYLNQRVSKCKFALGKF